MSIKIKKIGQKLDNEMFYIFVLSGGKEELRQVKKLLSNYGYPYYSRNNQIELTQENGQYNISNLLKSLREVAKWNK